jgi:hypothetical protein
LQLTDLLLSSSEELTGTNTHTHTPRKSTQRLCPDYLPWYNRGYIFSLLLICKLG